jgi:hypothetical protein
MAELGIRNFEDFDFISDPGFKNIKGAVRVLRLLEAIDEKRDLTSIGRMMVTFPIIPRLARMIVASIMEYPDVLEEILIAASFLNDRTPFLLPHGFELEARKAHHSFRHKLGDFVSYLKIFKAYTKAQNREEFCNRYYLDNRGMAEIFNVKRQLGEIVSGMNIPITGGGELSHYLSAVSKGLIQFVCKRSGKAQYSSLTAYGIKIHPGSVMFRQKPDFIVAGEVMKTSQMYARSVSPLNPELLKNISGELYAAFVQKRDLRGKKKEVRDYTNFIKIGSGIFNIQLDRKKKKVVILPLDKLQNAISGFDVEELKYFKGLRGKVVFNGYEMMSGMSLNRILSIIPKIQGIKEVVDKWPRGIHHEYTRDYYEIVRYIPHLLKPSKKTKNTKNLGFLTLLSDGDGSYWYSVYRDYVQALEESVSSLELLIDERVNVLTDDQHQVVNSTYRRLLELLEE